MPLGIVGIYEMQKCGLKYVIQTLPELEHKKAEPKLRCCMGRLPMDYLNYPKAMHLKQAQF
jgi:hypothetical protein